MRKSATDIVKPGDLKVSFRARSGDRRDQRKEVACIKNIIITTAIEGKTNEITASHYK